MNIIKCHKRKKYYPIFVEKIKKGEQQIKDGKIYKIDPKNVWESIDMLELQVDINNKLTPFKNLIALLKHSKLPLNSIIIQKEIEQCEKSIDYLTNIKYKK